MNFRHTLFIFILLLCFASYGQTYSFKIAKLKYQGGGDWYANKTALPNLISFFNQQMKGKIAPEEEIVEVSSPELMSYPFVYMTGHGNVVFSNEEAENLRNYLLAGGFLHIDDNYGLDKFVRPEMKKVFPELNFIELPYSHPVFKKPFLFSNGLPKVHEHDGKRPQAFALIYKGKIICIYTYESDLGNGWEDQAIYNDPEEVRQQALRMGVNILTFALSGDVSQ
jgi:hypothetical protein